MNGVTAGLRAFFGRHISYKVDFENEEYGNGNDHTEAALVDADVISSQLNVYEAQKATQYKLIGDSFELEQIYDLHQIVVDIDLPVYLVESTTPGHYHLYVELKQPISTERYFEWLEACSKIGLIEPGYVSAFEARGFTCVRLPWVTKLDGNLGAPEEIVDMAAEPGPTTFVVHAVPDDTVPPQSHTDMVAQLTPNELF